MIKTIGAMPKVAEFNFFSKAEGISDDELISSFLKFEADYISLQKGVMLHCLFKNSNGDFGSLLFTKDLITLHEVTVAFPCSNAFPALLNCIDRCTAQTQVHVILSEQFSVPEVFGCLEIGVFGREEDDILAQRSFLDVSEELECQNRDSSEDTVGYCIGRMNDGRYSEFVFGKNWRGARKAFYTYETTALAEKAASLRDPDLVELDFWSLIA